MVGPQFGLNHSREMSVACQVVGAEALARAEAAEKQVDALGALGPAFGVVAESSRLGKKSPRYRSGGTLTALY